MRCQRLWATRWCVSASLDAIDAVLHLSCANCYVISCHTGSMTWWQSCWNCHCVAVPMHQFYITFGVLVQCWTTPPEQQGCSPYVLLQKTEPRHVTCEFHAPTSKYIWNIFLQSPTKRHGQRMAHHIMTHHGKPTLIPLFFVTIYININHLLRWVINIYYVYLQKRRRNWQTKSLLKSLKFPLWKPKALLLPKNGRLSAKLTKHGSPSPRKPMALTQDLASWCLL